MAQYFRKILCPIDFDDGMVAGLDVARDLALSCGLPADAKICLLHVVHMLPTPEVPPPMDSYLAMEAEAKQRLDEIAREHLSGKVNYEVHTAIGEPAHEILGHVESLGADSVVMATHGRTGVKHLILGSVAERVVRECPRPVVTIHPHG
jgi:universal stress protein A